MKKINPNSPDNLLTPWLERNISNMLEYGHASLLFVSDSFLAHLLWFAKKHDKLEEMYDWLESEEATQFFSNSKFSFWGEGINHAIERISNRFHEHLSIFQEIKYGKNVDYFIDMDLYDELWPIFIDDFINEYNGNLRYKLYLN